MAPLPVLLVVPETSGVVDSARAFASTLATRLPPQVVATPSGFRIDKAYGPVRLHHPGRPMHPYIGLAMAAPAATPAGPGAYVVRGFIDPLDRDRLHDATKLPDGSPRLFADPEIGLNPTCGTDPPVGAAGDVRGLLGVGQLQALGLNGDGVAIAVVDNGINLDYLRSRGLSPTLDAQLSFSPLRTVTPGAAPPDHGTMCAFDLSIAAPDATLLDFAVLQSTRQGGSQMDGVLSDAVQAYGALLRLMQMGDGERSFHSLVVTNSWGMFHPSWDFPPGSPGRYADNPNHPFNIIVGSLSEAGADILFAAGNCGPQCPDDRCQGVVANTITGANSHPDVITVAGVDTQDNLVGYSSVGPGALFHDKPDIATYTHFLGSEVFGQGEPDSGTSAACPVMAGVVAALRSAVPFAQTGPVHTPQAVKAFLLSQGVRRGAGAPPGFSPNDGYGIATTAAFAQARGLIP